VPNLLTDRGFGVAGLVIAVNVRRLMYQTLMWAAVLRNDARGLSAPFHSEDLEGLADALIDRVRRNVELRRDFLGGEMLIDKP